MARFHLPPGAPWAEPRSWLHKEPTFRVHVLATAAALAVGGVGGDAHALVRLTYPVDQPLVVENREVYVISGVVRPEDLNEVGDFRPPAISLSPDLATFIAGDTTGFLFAEVTAATGFLRPGGGVVVILQVVPENGETGEPAFDVKDEDAKVAPMPGSTKHSFLGDRERSLQADGRHLRGYVRHQPHTRPRPPFHDRARRAGRQETYCRRLR